MAIKLMETADIAVIDAELAGSTPWEFESITQSGGNTFAKAKDARFHGTYGYENVLSTSNSAAYGKLTFPTKTEVYYRMYIKFKTGWSQTDNTFIRFQLLWGGSGRYPYTLYLYWHSATSTFGVRATSQHRFGSFTVYNNQAGSDVNLNQWYCFEFRYHGNDASTGGAEFWIDGVSKGSDYTRDTSYSEDWPRETRLGMTLSDGTPAGSIYLDDVLISTEAIGAYNAALVLADAEDAPADPFEFDTIYKDTGNTITKIAGAANKGDYGYKHTFDGTNDRIYGQRDFSDGSVGDTIYVRYYVWFPSGNYPYATYSGAAEVFNLGGLFGPGGSPWLAAPRMLLNDQGVELDIFGYRTTSLQTMAVDLMLSTDEWHCIEVQYTIGVSGSARMWVDGILRAEVTGIDTSSNSFGSIQIGPNYSSNPANMDPGQYIYFDDIVVAEGYIGLLGGVTTAKLVARMMLLEEF